MAVKKNNCSRVNPPDNKRQVKPMPSSTDFLVYLTSFISRRVFCLKKVNTIYPSNFKIKDCSVAHSYIPFLETDIQRKKEESNLNQLIHTYSKGLRSTRYFNIIFYRTMHSKEKNSLTHFFVIETINLKTLKTKNIFKKKL